MVRQAGLWDYEERLARLTKGGDPLVTLGGVVDVPSLGFGSSRSGTANLAYNFRRLVSHDGARAPA